VNGFGWYAHGWFLLDCFFLALVVQCRPGLDFYRGACASSSAAARIGHAGGARLHYRFPIQRMVLFTGSAGHFYFMEVLRFHHQQLSPLCWKRVLASALRARCANCEPRPQTGARLSVSGAETEVPAATLTIADRIALRPR